MISVILPVIDQHEVTEKCIKYLRNFSSKYLQEIIIVDNGSDVPYTDAIRNVVNKGLVESLRQGTAQASGDIIMFMHNDVLVHEGYWDARIRGLFDNDPLLGMAGFFGAPGVNPDGGRVAPESNMLGKEWGSPGSHHGTLLTEYAPASVLDGLCLIFRKSMLEKEGIPECPPHHWYDRILPLYYIERGWRCATIGIAFDHGSGFTSSKKKYRDFAQSWCEEHNITAPNGDYDLAIYLEGEKQFRSTWGHRLPLYVTGDYNYRWSS